MLTRRGSGGAVWRNPVRAEAQSGGRGDVVFPVVANHEGSFGRTVDCVQYLPVVGLVRLGSDHVLAGGDEGVVKFGYRHAGPEETLLNSYAG